MSNKNLTINNKQYDYKISETKLTYKELLEYIREFNLTNIDWHIPTEEESDIFSGMYWTTEHLAQHDVVTQSPKNVIMIREIINWDTPERWHFI